MEFALIQCWPMALMLGNLFFASSHSPEPQTLQIGIMLKFLLRNLQNHSFTQQYFIRVIVNYASQKERAEDVTEDCHHLLMYKESISNVYSPERSKL